MFIWTSIAHMALPLGEAGVREIPNEQAVLAAMQANIGGKSGLYLFPGFGLGPNATRQQRKEAMQHMGEKIASNPSGILMYHTPGRALAVGNFWASNSPPNSSNLSSPSSCWRRPVSSASARGSASSWSPEF
jgi:hypothetical protein